MRILIGLLGAAALVGFADACSLDGLTGTKPKAACTTRSYHDTIYVRYDSIPDTLYLRLGGCKS